MCRFVESIRLHNGQLYNLDYHQERLERTLAEHFPGVQAFKLETIPVPDEYAQGLYKLRVLYDEKITDIEYHPYTPRKIRKICKVYSDSISYSYKYANRDCINSLAPIDREDDEDFLIIKDGYVTDLSSSSIAFFDGTKWCVPDTPLLPGTTRDRLLAKGAVVEKAIREADIEKYECCSVFNAMIDFKNIVLEVSAIR